MSQLEQIEKDEQDPLVQALTSNTKFTPEQIQQRKKMPKDMCEEGRKLISEQNYFEASKSFSKAVMAFEFLLKEQLIYQEEAKLFLKDSIIPSYSNLALCYLKLGHYQSVISFANQVLLHDSAHSKSIYRRAMAYKNLKKYDEAIEDLIKLSKINPDEQQLSKQQIKKCKQLKAQAKQKEKLMAKRLLSGYQRQQQSQSSNPQIQTIVHLNFLGKAMKCIRETCSKIFRKQ